jgi:hypothetical protein
MLKETQLSLRIPVTASAERGVVAEDAVVTLRRTVDKNGRVIRENDDVITLGIVQSSTKEVPDGIRTLVRVDRASNGDIPASSAHAVITGSDTPLGRESALSALFSLLVFLLNNTADEDHATPLDADWRVTLNDEIGTTAITGVELRGRLARVIRGEA